MVVTAEDRIQRRSEVLRYAVVADKLTLVPSADGELAESSSGLRVPKPSSFWSESCVGQDVPRLTSESSSDGYLTNTSCNLFVPLVKLSLLRHPEALHYFADLPPSSP